MTDEAIERYFGKCRFGEFIYAELKNDQHAYLFGRFVMM